MTGFKILDSLNLSVAGYRVAGYLLAHAAGGEVAVSIKTLAAKCRLKKDTVIKAIAELVQNGVVSVVVAPKYGHGSASNKYVISPMFYGVPPNGLSYDTNGVPPNGTLVKNPMFYGVPPNGLSCEGEQATATTKFFATPSVLLFNLLSCSVLKMFNINFKYKIKTLNPTECQKNFKNFEPPVPLFGFELKEWQRCARYRAKGTWVWPDWLLQKLKPAPMNFLFQIPLQQSQNKIDFFDVTFCVPTTLEYAVFSHPLAAAPLPAPAAPAPTEAATPHRIESLPPLASNTPIDPTLPHASNLQGSVARAPKVKYGKNEVTILAPTPTQKIAAVAAKPKTRRNGWLATWQKLNTEIPGLDIHAWEHWLADLDERKPAPRVTVGRIQAQLKKLAELSQGEPQRQIVERSIERGWQSFFPDRSVRGNVYRGRPRTMAEANAEYAQNLADNYAALAGEFKLPDDFHLS